MAGFSKTQLLSQLESSGVIPVFYHADAEACKKVIRACYHGGIRTFEYTNRGKKALQVFSILSAYLEKEFPDAALGAGSIMDAGTASMFIREGAHFIVAPAIKESVSLMCRRNDIPWIPGCATPTEVARAEELGAEIVKIFPGAVLGPDFIKALKGPMPRSRFMVTGGVEPSEESLQQWFSAGATCVGLGSQFINDGLIEKENYEGLEKRAGEVVEIYRRIRHNG